MEVVPRARTSHVTGRFGGIKETPNGHLSWGCPGGAAGKESARNAGDLGSVPGLGRSPGEGKGCPLQYSSRENCMDYVVYGIAKSRTRLSDFHFTSLHFVSADTEKATLFHNLKKKQQNSPNLEWKETSSI
ncbi:unnamed protein product [Rangifer tarandus platyrhynchus]|uniref:Uncharacterized protein n=2 Tax=Rangifer tarandus platyrhynchus TaxID=3082113 RepID=A0AC60A7M9_RANTA|nr:unnamed protein product [Rangifer tarandus platyrhynchus]